MRVVDGCPSFQLQYARQHHTVCRMQPATRRLRLIFVVSIVRAEYGISVYMYFVSG